jgi:hypothetical protein
MPKTKTYFEICGGIDCERVIASKPDKAYEFCSQKCKSSTLSSFSNHSILRAKARKSVMNREFLSILNKGNKV